MGGTLALNVMRQHGRAAWVVPSYKNGRALWRMAEGLCRPLESQKMLDVSRSERTITTPHGGLLAIYSADNADAIRGETFHLVVLDEAARISQEAREDAILPTLADTEGTEVAISTPKGLNWFYQEFQRADHKAIAAWRFPSSDNPSPQIQRAAQLARERVPERTYRQEWLAEFVESGAYFQNVAACAVVEAPDRPDQHQGHHVVMGVDWGRIHDFTVLTLLCRECSRVVDWERMGGMEYRSQRARLKRLAEMWNVVSILPERNAMGAPNIEELVAERLPVLPGLDDLLGWNMTAANKPILIETLALALEREQVRVPCDYAEELRAFEVDIKPSGASAFGAPEGAFDDRVISLGLAWQAALLAGPVVLFG